MQWKLATIVLLIGTLSCARGSFLISRNSGALAITTASITDGAAVTASGYNNASLLSTQNWAYDSSSGYIYLISNSNFVLGSSSSVETKTSVTSDYICTLVDKRVHTQNTHKWTMSYFSSTSYMQFTNKVFTNKILDSPYQGTSAATYAADSVSGAWRQMFYWDAGSAGSTSTTGKSSTTGSSTTGSSTTGSQSGSCGNKVLNSGEQCDSGNGCDSDCDCEAGYTSASSVNCKNLLTSSLLGGSGDDAYNGAASVDVDSSGNIFVGFDTTSTGIASTSAYQTTIKGMADAYIQKRSTAGKILWATYIGGSDQEFVQSVATDSSGNVYVCGYTLSSNFPTTSGSAYTSYPSSASGSTVGFVAKFSGSSGSRIWSSYYGSSSSFDQILTCDVDNATNTLITAGRRGISSSTTFGAQVAKWSSDGTSVTWSYTYGAMDDATFLSVKVANSQIFLSGYSLIPAAGSFPIKSAAQSISSGTASDATITCLSSSGTVVWSTFLGGWGDEYATSIALNGASVYVVGYSTSFTFPVTKGSNTANMSLSAFVAEYSQSTGAKSNALFFASDRYPTSAVFNSAGNLYVSGRTTSPYSPQKALQMPPGGGFVAKFSSSLTISSSFDFGDQYDYFEQLVGGSSVYGVGYVASTDFSCISSSGVSTSCSLGGYSDVSLISVML